ncbi:cytochrome P450 [Frigidibacter sp. MR17.24]|uniref:cytochrome P450 n=1 Tax=Frigidibacter sp. MR17.24 TaxID=3127345 RepID=UPI0030130453
MTFPKLSGRDHTSAFLREGYAFIGNRCDRLDTDAFRARLMLRPVLCLRGPEAAALFYDGHSLTRRGAMPATVLRLLQDKGSVQGLDDAAHLHRKAMFVRLLMSRDGIDSFLAIFREQLRQAVEIWVRLGEIRLHDELSELLARSACRWLGLPGESWPDWQVLAMMIDQAGGTGPGVAVALLRRARLEARLRSLVRDWRRKGGGPPEGSPGRELLEHRGADGQRIPTASAVVELLNVLRPVTAIARYIQFAVLALETAPEARDRLAGASDDVLDAALQAHCEEARRLCPFFPAIGGIARTGLIWQGHQIAAGSWLLLDIYGTLRDPRLFERPLQFDAGRGLDWRRGDHGFIPQGGGRAETGHRCPGEAMTLAAMTEALRCFVRELDWQLPVQDLSLPLRPMPARPPVPILLSGIRRR